MTPVKKRKLNNIDAPRALSAFAARRQLATSSFHEANHQHEVELQGAPMAANAASSNAATSSRGKKSKKSKPYIGQALEPSENVDEKDDEKPSSSDMSFPSSDSTEKAISITTAKKHVPLSSIRPTRSNLKVTDDAVHISLEPGERLVVLGEYDLFVRAGQISILGGILAASTGRYRVYAPASHSLPVIRCNSNEPGRAEITLHSCDSGLPNLGLLSPLFGNIWSSTSNPLPDAWSRLARSAGTDYSFRILATSDDSPPRMLVQPVFCPPEWNERLGTLGSTAADSPAIVMVCGPKSSGKSTFSRMLANRLLSTTRGKSEATNSSAERKVYWLDLDPGQPEFSPPGHISLIEIQELIFGPPFAHPHTSRHNKTIWSHSVASTSPASDPTFFLSCVGDLVSRFKSRGVGSPLIINTPGWVLGTGLRILIYLIEQISLGNIIYMSQEGPAEVVKVLRDTAGGVPLSTLPSQQSEYVSRTAAQLRAMQAMSYFHCTAGDASSLLWSSHALATVRPWRVKYRGDVPGIACVASLGEGPSPELLTEALNGSIVSIVVYDQAVIDTGESAAPGRRTFGSRVIETSDGLPFLPPARHSPLHPSHSHTLGQALIRGIDASNGELHILTPIPSQTLTQATAGGKVIILVSGKLDTPGWAYTEQFNLARKATNSQKTPRQLDDDTSGDDSSGDDSPLTEEASWAQAPWVERITGHQGRGVGNRVWRVRRDLGKRSNGAD